MQSYEALIATPSEVSEATTALTDLLWCIRSAQRRLSAVQRHSLPSIAALSRRPSPAPRRCVQLVTQSVCPNLAEYNFIGLFRGSRTSIEYNA